MPRRPSTPLVGRRRRASTASSPSTTSSRWGSLGGPAPSIHQLAVEKKVALNVWDVAADALPADVEVTWGGPPRGHDGWAALAAAGATWAVSAPPPSSDWPSVVGDLARLRGVLG